MKPPLLSVALLIRYLHALRGSQSDRSGAIKNSIENDPVLEQMLHHKGIRTYTDEPVSEADLRAIIEVVQHGPNWCNFQHVSIVSVDDPIKRQKAYEPCGFQEHVREAPVFWMFCVDFYRTWFAALTRKRS